VANPTNALESEHQHYGPYMYLKIATLPTLDLTTTPFTALSDLTRLANLVEARLASCVPGSAVRIESEFAENTPYALILDLSEDGFDPAAADRLLPPESDPDR
jgi:hypothetical protein